MHPLEINASYLTFIAPVTWKVCLIIMHREILVKGEVTLPTNYQLCLITRF